MKKISKLKYVSLFMRSLIFSVFMMVFTMFYSFICLMTYPLPIHYRCKTVGLWSRIIVGALKLICGVNFRIEGRANIPPHDNAIIMSKHQSTWETFFMQYYFRDVAIIAKRELLWVPFFGWGLAVTGPITINRSQKSSAMTQIIQKGRQFLAAGRWILVFPEGTRIASGQVGKYHIGGARLAAETGYPILPIAHNAGRYWSKRGFIKMPGTIHVVIGPIIEVKDRKADELLALTKDWIEETMTRIDKK